VLHGNLAHTKGSLQSRVRVIPLAPLHLARSPCGRHGIHGMEGNWNGQRVYSLACFRRPSSAAHQPHRADWPHNRTALHSPDRRPGGRRLGRRAAVRSERGLRPCPGARPCHGRIARGVPDHASGNTPAGWRKRSETPRGPLAPRRQSSASVRAAVKGAAH